jgi:hypothetical protein
MVAHIQKLYAAHVKEDIGRGREAVTAEVAQSDLPWSARAPKMLGHLPVNGANGSYSNGHK